MSMGNRPEGLGDRFAAIKSKPMDRDKLRELAGRAERATGPDREVDIAILPLVGLRFVDEGHPIGRVCYDTNNHAVPMPRYTASLDAAMSLVPEGLHFGCGDRDTLDKAWAWVAPHPFSEYRQIVSATTPALALTAAALRALAEDNPHVR